MMIDDVPALTADTALVSPVIADALPSLIWTSTAAAGNIHVNARYAEYCGCDATALFGDRWRAVVHPDDLGLFTQRFAARGEDGATIVQDLRLRGADGGYRWFLVQVAPLCDGARRVVQRLGHAIDIDNHKRTQLDLIDALSAKDALLHEVSHRVKNSLQLVTSLLSLQAAQTGEGDARQSVIAARNRIAVVAGVHRRLYWTHDSDAIDLADYLPALVEEAVAGLPGGGMAIEIVAPEPAPMPLTRAVPLALVISELCRNAVSHGLAGGAGAVRVTLTTGPPLEITVSDDGAGLPPGFDPDRPAGLGMRIVTALSRQAHAALSVEPRARGACFKLSLAQ